MLISRTLRYLCVALFQRDLNRNFLFVLDIFALLGYNQGGRGKAPGSPVRGGRAALLEEGPLSFYLLIHDALHAFTEFI